MMTWWMWLIVALLAIAVLTGIGLLVRWLLRRKRESGAGAALAVENMGRASADGEIEAVGTRSVDRIDITNWQATGLKTSIDRYTMVLEFWWTENDGTARHHGPQTYTWPNDLAGIPLGVLKGWAEQIIVQAVRYNLGIDPIPEP